MQVESRARRLTVTLGVAAAGLIGATLAVLLFEQAVPQVRLTQKLTAPLALSAARSFARAHELPFPEGRTAVHFAEEDSLQLFLELAAPNGKAALDTIAASGDVALFRWTVRALTPGDVHETRVRFAPDGRVTGFWRRLAETDRRPELDSAAAASRAREVLTQWMGKDAGAWPLLSASREVVPASGRVNRSFTFERSTGRIAGAPLRMDVDIAGDLVVGAREYVVIPESFARRYAEMRSSNELLASLAAFGFPVYGLLALIALYRAQRDGAVRWRGAIVAASVIAGLQAAAMANDIPGSWYAYSTTSAPGTFLLRQALGALLVPILFGAFLVVVLAGGESLVRTAFPEHLDWWSAWRARGTQRFTKQVLAGYALCAVGLGYVATFYLVARSTLGWWVPSALLDDPNAIATPLPFLSAIANAAQAGVMEEVLFRAVPLSAIGLLTRGRSWQRGAMVLGVIGTALVFGFAHASYASWPAYSRGVELFAEATLWAVIFLRFGLVPTVVCHFTFDLLLFGLFAMAGDAPAYRVSLAVVVATLLAPAAIVMWAQWRRAAQAPAWETLTFSAWQAPVERDPGDEAPAPREGDAVRERETTAYGDASREPDALRDRVRSREDRRPAASAAHMSLPLDVPLDVPLDALLDVPLDATHPRTGRDLRLLMVAAGALALLVPRDTNIAEPRYSVARLRAIAIADSVLRARGAHLDGLAPMAEVIGGDDAEGARFLAHIERPALAAPLARSYRALAGWGVRFDRREGTVAEKAEGWRLHLLADGTPHDWRHVIAEDAARPDLPRDSARLIALRAAAASGIDTSALRDAGVDEEQRPHRHDLLFTFDDRGVTIPGGATARVRVRVAGNEAVGVARALRFPERWERADAAAAEQRATVAMVAGIALVLAVLVPAFVVGRRAPRRDDHALTRRQVIVLLAALLALQAGHGLNALPDALAQWDTATPWTSHVVSAMVAIAAQLFVLVLPASLWLSAEALRRRTRLPVATSSGEVMRSGFALGALALGTSQLSFWLGTLSGTMRGANTALGAFWPVAANALDVLTSAAVLPLLVVLPALLLAGVAERRWVRPALMIGGALVVAIVLTARGEGSARLAPLVAAAIIVIGYAWWHAVARWGRDGLAAWVIAAAVYAGLEQLSLWPMAAHDLDRLAALGGVLAAALVVAVVHRLVRARERVTTVA